MREILYRAKVKDKNELIGKGFPIDENGNLKSEWVFGVPIPHYPDLFLAWNEACNEYEEVTIIPETVGQYTGLTDKNGTKIFEGDIVKGKSEYFGNGSLNQKAVVLYDRGQFLLSFGETLEECKQLNDFEVVGVWSGDVEVIGNIHDNPELLKE